MAWSMGLLGGAGYTVAGNYDLLQSTALTGTAASVTFNNLNSLYGSTYQHLQIRAVVKSAISDTAGNIEMTFNGVGGTSYSWHRMAAEYVGGVFDNRGSGSDSVASMRIGRTTGLSAVANTFAPNVIDVFYPFDTGKATTTRGFTGVTDPGDQRVVLSSGLFDSTAAVSTVSLTATNGFVSGSKFSLYGIKAV